MGSNGSRRPLIGLITNLDPFGGFMQSGIGRERGPDTVDASTEIKNVVIVTEES